MTKSDKLEKICPMFALYGDYVNPAQLGAHLLLKTALLSLHNGGKTKTKTEKAEVFHS